jgi:hypothetical protein
VTPGKRRAVSPSSLFLKCAAAVTALGVYAGGMYLLWRVVHEPLFLKWAAVVVALVVYAGGIYLLWRVVRLLWRVVRKPLFLKCAAVVAALGVYAAGIYWLWGVVREPLFLKWAAVVAALGVYAAGIYWLWRVVREPLFLKWAAVVAALGVCAVGILLLWGVWDGTPVAAAFTRVGGATQVETALEASRFWLTPPQLVVETQADASQQIMLWAAQCAMAHDAPLLFTSPDPKRQQLVDATINDWRQIETPTRKDFAPPELTIQRQRNILQLVRLPDVITIQDKSDRNRCLPKGHLADIAGLSTLKAPKPLIPLPQVRPRQTLEPVVVFAAAIEPEDPPDVAVGLALAAHMARANRENVSLVVVPHYLESDHKLEDKLEGQHELVTGGVVLGETPTVPEDTRVLLRQLLTSRDRQGVLAQVQANLGSVGSLIAALLALAGLAAASRIAVTIGIDLRERAERERPERERKERERNERERNERERRKQGRDQRREKLVSSIREFWGDRVSATQEKSDWLIALGEDQHATVTVWLRSGLQVTGTIEGQFPPDARDATVFRITNVSLVTNSVNPSRGVSLSRPDGKNVLLVSVKDIELIDINDSKPEAEKAGQASGGAEIRTGGQGQDRPAGEQ